MATLAPQKASRTGANIVLGASAAGGDIFPWAPNRAVRAKNAAGGAVTVTVQAQHNCSHGFTHDLVVNIPAGAERTIGGLDDRSRFADDSGYVHLAYSDSPNTTIAVVEV